MLEILSSLIDVISDAFTGDAITESVGEAAEASADSFPDVLVHNTGHGVELFPAIPREMEPELYADWEKAAAAAGVTAPGKIYYDSGCAGGVCCGDPSNPNDDIGIIDPKKYHAVREQFGDDAYVPIFGHECGHQMGALSGSHDGLSAPARELECDAMAAKVASKTGSPMTGFDDMLQDDPGDSVHPNGAFRVARAALHSAAIESDPFRQFVAPDKNPLLDRTLKVIDRALWI